jgi:hypothetical protein
MNTLQLLTVVNKITHFCNNNLNLGNKYFIDATENILFSPIRKNVDAISNFLQKNFQSCYHLYDEKFLVACAKLFYRLFQLVSFYDKAHSPSLFMSPMSKTQPFKFCSDLGRYLDEIDRERFLNNGKLAANHSKLPLNQENVYELFVYDDNNEKQQNARSKTDFRYRAVETKAETLYNGKVTTKCKKRVYREVMPNFLSYISCCLMFNDFKNVKFGDFCLNQSVGKYKLETYNISLDTGSSVLSDNQWIESLISVIVQQLGIRGIAELRDGIVSSMSRIVGRKTKSGDVLEKIESKKLSNWKSENSFTNIDTHTISVDNNPLMVLAHVASKSTINTNNAHSIYSL